MDFRRLLNDRRTITVGGAALAMFAALGLAMCMARKDRPDGPDAPPAPGLTVEMGRDDDLRLDPNKLVTCFVKTEVVGMLTVAECAKRNGVATGQLDVGIDETGGLAVGDQAGALITPLPPTAAAQPAPAATGPVAQCWRYEQGSWARVSEVTRNACVQTLYNGRCEQPGGAAYGRWGETTLRLIPGRVELQRPDGSFDLLVEQGANCQLGAL